MMNRNLYVKELKRNSKSLFVWTAIVIVFTILVLSIFPYMKNMGDQMAAMMSQLPKGMTKAMGINADTFLSILGMYNTYYGIYIIVLLSIYSSSTAATIISKEEKDKTAEFLMTKPITRKSIFETKISTLFTLMFLAYGVQTIVAFVFVILLGGDNIDWSIFMTMHTHGLVLIILFTCIGLFVSMLFNSRKNFMAISVALIFGSYFIDAISKIADKVNWLGYISPFHYLDFNVADINYSINVFNVFVAIILASVLIVMSYHIYNKRDIVA